MITVKDLAAALGVSRTAVYTLVKRKGIPTFKQDSLTYFDDNAEALIRAHYSSERQETIQDIIDVEQDIEHVESGLNAGLIRLLEEQLKENSATIQGLIQSNQSLIQLLNNEQRLRGQQLLSVSQDDTPPVPVKKSWIAKIFKRG